LDSEDKVLTPALKGYIGIFAEVCMEVYEGMAAVIVEERALPDAGKVQSILCIRELQERMGSQLHATHNVLAAGREGDEEQEDIVTRYIERYVAKGKTKESARGPPGVPCSRVR
jgi:hypothetical protein